MSPQDEHGQDPVPTTDDRLQDEDLDNVAGGVLCSPTESPCIDAPS